MPEPAPRHFLDLHRLEPALLRALLDHAKTLKAAPRSALLTGRNLAMIFEKPSTRTRVSFAAGIHQLGGQAIDLSMADTQLGRGETIEDTARVLSRYVDAILLRTDSEAKLYQLAEAASVPVINGLTDRSHPCQILADLMTVQERLGPLNQRQIAWIGDFNNVARSFVHAAAAFGFAMRIATPESLAPDAQTLDWARQKGVALSVGTEPEAAARGADVVVTDTWVSMNNNDGERRRRLLTPYQVNAALMARAATDAIFLHCLPAHRDEEVTAEVIDGPQSAVFDEAENRLHVQKAILAWCLGA